MTRQEKRAEAQKRRNEIQVHFLEELDAAFQTLRGSGTINTGELWKTFFNRLDRRRLLNDQMYMQELCVFKRNYEQMMSRAAKAEAENTSPKEVVE